VVVVGDVTGRAAAMIGSHAEIVTSQWRVAPMSEESVAITGARRSCSPRGVPLPIRWRMTSPRLKPHAFARPHEYPQAPADSCGRLQSRLVMRHLIGSGTPRGLQDRLAPVIATLSSLMGATRHWLVTISAWLPIMAAARPVTSPTTTTGDSSVVTTYTTGC